MSTCRLHSECKHEALFALRTRPVEAIPRTACAASCVFTINPSTLLSNLPVLFTTWLPLIRMEDCPPHHHHIPPSLSLSLSLWDTQAPRVVQKPSIRRHNVITRSERERWRKNERGGHDMQHRMRRSERDRGGGVLMSRARGQ